MGGKHLATTTVRSALGTTRPKPYDLKSKGCRERLLRAREDLLRKYIPTLCPSEETPIRLGVLVDAQRRAERDKAVREARRERLRKEEEDRLREGALHSSLGNAIGDTSMVLEDRTGRLGGEDGWKVVERSGNRGQGRKRKEGGGGKEDESTLKSDSAGGRGGRGGQGGRGGRDEWGQRRGGRGGLEGGAKVSSQSWRRGN